MKKNPLEWGVFGVGLILTLGVVGFLAREAVAGKGGPPRFVLTPGALRQTGDGYELPVRVRNSGDTSAEGVRVSLGDAEAELEHLPHDTEGEVVLRFEKPPTERPRVTGYRSP